MTKSRSILPDRWPVLVLSALSMLACFYGCKSYAELFSVAEKIEAGKSVGVLVFEGEGKLMRSGKGGFLESAVLAGLVQNSGMKVIAMHPEEIGSVVVPEEKYGLAGPVAAGVLRAGAQSLDKVMGWNEVKEGEGRLDAWIKLMDAYQKQWAVDYVVIVWHPCEFDYRGRLVKLVNRQIVADAFMTGNDKGWGFFNAFERVFAEQKRLSGQKFYNLSPEAKASLVFALRFVESIS